MKVIKPDFSCLGKYYKFDADFFYEKSDGAFVLEVRERGGNRERFILSLEDWKFSFFNFTVTRYLIFLGCFLFCGLILLSFFSKVRDLWYGVEVLSVGFFWNIILCICFFILVLMLLIFWFGLGSFRGFVVINRKIRDAKREGWVIGIETKEELRRISDYFALFINKEQKEKVKEDGVKKRG